jgi:NAD(P)-dependent dehydrogenase (short-subunit alcohol dehydrogenase family)
MPNESASTTRAVLITGASTGIGAATAMRLDRAGWRVFAGVRKPADGDALRAQASGRLTPVIIDVTDPASIDAAAGEVARETGDAGLDGLVNNAGISVPGPVELLPLEDLRRQLEVNVVGQVAVTQAFMPLIRTARGRIVFISSIGGRFSTPFLGAYCASKYALEALADAMRLEMRPWRIHIALVEPGSIKTPFWDKGLSDAEVMEARLSPEDHARYDQAIASVKAVARDFERRGIPPEAVAKAIEHALTSPRPKTRYLVGIDAKLQAALATWVPDRVTDGLVAWQLKLTKSGADAAPAATTKEPIA